MKEFIVWLLVAGATYTTSLAQNAQSDGILGTWLTEDGNLNVKITPSARTYQGLIVWMKEPTDNGTPKLDKLNPDPSKRTNPVLGKTLIVYDLKFDGDDAWEDGTIYDSRKGKAYGCKITMKDLNRLRVRGFLGVSLLGQANEWKRVD